MTSSIELRLPAAAHSWLSAVRTVAASVASTDGYAPDDIGDLCLAVDEVCAMVLPYARLSSSLLCSFSLQPTGVRFTAQVECVEIEPRSDPHAVGDRLSWQVLEAVADGAAVDVVGPTSAGLPAVMVMSIDKRRLGAPPPGL